jgi:hypothetical protein
MENLDIFLRCINSMVIAMLLFFIGKSGKAGLQLELNLYKKQLKNERV